MSDQRRSVQGVILAGGYRWEKSTFDQLLARPLVPVAHKPLISYALTWLWHAEVPCVTVCGNRDTRELRDPLNRHVPKGMAYAYVEDPMPRGAAGCLRDAALRARDFASAALPDAFVVTDAAALPNAVDLHDLLGCHWASGADVTVAAHTDQGWGGAIGSNIPAGIYVVSRAALDGIPEHGFVDIKEHFIPTLLRAGGRVVAYPVAAAVPRVLNAQTYLAVNAMATESRVAHPDVPARYVRRGETLMHSEAWVAPDAVLAGPVLIGQGARIEAGAVVIGPTSIGCDVTVQPGALVSRSAVWRRSIVRAGASIDSCILGDGAVAQSIGAVTSSDTVRTADAVHAS